MAIPEIFTIGHSNHSIERFVELLRQHGVTALADVRSAPYSRHNPQYNKEALESELKRNGIAYVFLGKELGARSNDPTCYENGRVVYGRLARTEDFRKGIERVRKGAEDHRIALMCAEKEPLDCHRTLLVSRELEATGTPVAHILADGGTENHEQSMKRLLGIHKMSEDDMFGSRDDMIAQAYEAQEKRIAYVDEQLEKENGKA